MVTFPFYLLTVGVICTTPIKEDALKRDWTTNDQWVLGNAIKGCMTRLNGRSPCLKRLIKLPAFQSYHAICGGQLNGK